jgi:hypothetical protein
MKNYRMGLFLVSALALQGCAHGKAEKRIDDQLAAEPQVSSRTELSQQAERLISTAPGLTEEQKTRLLQLSVSVRAQGDEYRKESLLLRELLIKDVISSDYNAQEVSLVKKRIRKLEEKRVATIFDAVETANRILGRQAREHADVLDVFMTAHGHGAL